MPRERIRSRLLAGGGADVDVPPMVGRDVSWIDPAGFDGVDRPQNVVDLGPAIDAQKNCSAAGTYERQGRKDSRAVTARAVSILETTVPKSLAAQRTKAKTAGRKAHDAPPAVDNCFLGGAAKADPVSISLSSQVSSTRVRSLLLFSVR